MCLFVVGFVFVCVVCLGLLVFLFVVCFVSLFSCWDCILDCVQVHYQYFCGYRLEAMKALDGKKSKGATFSGQEAQPISFLFTIPKVAPLHPWFFFRRKKTAIDRAVIPSEVERLEPSHNFSNLGTFPYTLQTMIEKNEIMQHLHQERTED